ncbi:hypothetical protein F4780DRAFT_345326 [Xylariomycetidae sp. FL0641]|nr:hypothetical protein F4780DRAFT_345326 [Xylariomycetidae sp. FL0641]
MSSIGPELPPHLSKRKRSQEDDATADSPPAKVHAKEGARLNQDEVDLDSDSDDGYGPSAPKPTARPSIGPAMPPSVGPAPPPSIGPSLPPSSASRDAPARDGEAKPIEPSAPAPTPTSKPKKGPSIGPTMPPSNTDEIPLDDSDDDETGPAPPPPAKRVQGPAPPPSEPAEKRVQGPAPPPAPLDERPADPPSDSDSDSDSDDYGPALPTSSAQQARQSQAQRALAAAAAAAAGPTAPQRDDWMLAPPTGGSAADPTKLKNRRFNSGPRASTTTTASGGNNNNNNNGGIGSIWTETPEQKRQRLEAQVLGRETGSGHPTTSSSQPQNRNQAADQADAQRIADFTSATRGRSLYAEHQAREGAQGSGRIQDEEDDPSQRAFDKEKDMKLGGRIGTAQRRELLDKAADFGGRFAKGKFL